MSKVVTDIQTLRGMAKAGHIKLDPATGKKVNHWTGQPIKACYIDDAVGPTHFTYRGAKYRIKYFDGCFNPFVVEDVSDSELPSFV
jgi:hypothetical protein